MGGVAGCPDLFYGSNDQVCDFLFCLLCEVRQAIQDIYTCILLYDVVQHFLFQFPVSGKSQVDKRIAQRTLQDIGPGHSRTGRTGSLCDGGTIEYDRLFRRLRDKGQFAAFGSADLHPFYRII